jgi:hypothetical protein
MKSTINSFFWDAKEVYLFDGARSRSISKISACSEQIKRVRRTKDILSIFILKSDMGTIWYIWSNFYWCLWKLFWLCCSCQLHTHSCSCPNFPSMLGEATTCSKATPSVMKLTLDSSTQYSNSPMMSRKRPKMVNFWSLTESPTARSPPVHFRQISRPIGEQSPINRISRKWQKFQEDTVAVL